MPEQTICNNIKPETEYNTTRKWVWKSIQNILVIKKINDDDVHRYFLKMIKWIISQKRKVFIEPQNFEQEEYGLKEIKDYLFKFCIEDSQIDLIITIGGDGTLLYAASLFQKEIPPVMPFHAGSLGFLTRFSFKNFESKIQRVLKSQSSCVNYRSRLLVIVKSEDNSSTKEEKYLVLNDVVVERNLYPFLSNVDLFINDNYITTLQGDGIIISTPTGSTAYSSSAGASILHPSVKGNIITPICPHSLSFRPVVIPENVDIKIRISPESRNSGFICLDGRVRQELKIGDTLQITTSQYPVPTLLANDEIQEWFDSLRTCLHWNDRERQKPFKKT